MAATDRFFWLRDGLEIGGGRLVVAGRDAEGLARQHGTPLYVYDLDRIADKLRDLREALDSAGVDGLVRFAVKANHHPEVLEVIRDLGAGIDASSPGEVELALAEGFAPDAISFTGTNLTDRDMRAVIDREVHLNVDLLSQLRRYGRLAPGTAVGVRVNPRAGGASSGSGETLYSGDRPTKFGLYEEQLDEALAIAEEHDLAIDVVHMHVGDGFLDDGLDGFEEAVERAAEITQNLLDAGCPIREVNTGGGLGVPQAPGEQTLDLDAYAAILEKHLDRLGVTVSCEPGDYLVKDSAVLLCEVVTVEDRLGVTFIGLDAGWNVMPDKFVYGVSPDIVLARAVDAPVSAAVTVAGHINEGDDLFAEEHPMPDVREGDIVAMMDVGGYHQSMSSTHCLRPHAPALFLLRD
jgi:diaminopimelate decarboxylase